MKTSAEQMVERYKADERTAQVNEKGLAACGVAAIFYVTFRIIYVGFRGGLAVPELVLLFVMAAMMSLVKKKNNLQELPVLFGRRLDPAPEAFPKRLLLYVLSALRLSVAWTLLDVAVRGCGDVLAAEPHHDRVICAADDTCRLIDIRCGDRICRGCVNSRKHGSSGSRQQHLADCFPDMRLLHNDPPCDQILPAK